MARSKRQRPAPASDPRQPTIGSYFAKASPATQSSPLSRPQAAADKSSPETVIAVAAPVVDVVDVDALSGPRRLRSTARAATKPQSKPHSGSASSDPILLDASDDENCSSPTSSYVDIFEPSADSESNEHSAEDGMGDKSSGVVSNDSLEEADSSEDLEPPKRKRETKQTTLFSGGKLAIRAAPKSKPAKKTGAQDMVRNHDSWAYKLGIDTSLPPLHDIEDIFYDMTSHGRRLGLEKALRHLAGRNLRIATMCSGTESPLLALDLVSGSKLSCLGSLAVGLTQTRPKEAVCSCIVRRSSV